MSNEYSRGGMYQPLVAKRQAADVRRRAGSSQAWSSGNEHQSHLATAAAAISTLAHGARATAPEVLSLQRMAGNRAVSTLVPVQRMNLEQAGATKDLKPDNTRKLVDGGRSEEVNMYTDHAFLKAADKKSALQAAAARNGQIGKRADDVAQAKWGIADSNLKWTGPKQALNEPTLRKIDPFFYECLVNYKQKRKYGEEEVEDNENVGFLFQHAKNWTGYVESLLDSSSPPTTAPTSGHMYTDTHKPEGEEGGKLKFSNRHDTTKGSNLLEMTSGQEEHNLDAYTKIVGEGSRWQCVRKHAGNLQNDSLFFTSVGRGDFKGITFRTLWLSWKDVFGKKYDIPDAEVAAAIKANSFERSSKKKKSGLRTADYNLDSGESHKPS